MEAVASVAGDDIHEDDTYVCGGVLADSPKLSWMKKVMGDSVELKALGKDLGKEFAQGVEERDGVEGFGQVIPVLFGFRDDDGVRRFKLRWPCSAVKDAVENVS